MSRSPAVNILLVFVLAVVVATVLATLVQSQVNLHALRQIGVPISAGDRLEVSGKDLIGFTPLMALLVTVSFIFALPAAELVGRVVARWRAAIYFLAGAVGIWVAFRVTDMIAPPPVYIAATREWGGTLAMMAAVALGSALFAILTRRHSRVPEGGR